MTSPQQKNPQFGGVGDLLPDVEPMSDEEYATFAAAAGFDPDGSSAGDLLPDEPPATQDELGMRAGQLFQSLTSTVQDIVALQGEMTSPETLGQCLADWRDHKQDVARAFDDCELLFLGVAGEKKLEVPGVGQFEVKSAVRRTRWDHDELFRHVLARISDDPHLFFDVEDGAAKPPAAIAAALVERLRDVLSPSWKVTGIRGLGLDPDEFCETDEQHWSVKLPPRSEAA